MTPRKSGAERRLEIIETTLRLAAVAGPDSISADAIARELGISQPAIFRHFPKKDDIWIAALDWLAATLRDLWAESLERAPGGQVLPTLVGDHLDFITSHPALPQVLLSPDLQARYQPVRQITACLTSMLHAAVERAALADGLPLAEGRAAWLVVSLIQGLALRWTNSGRAFDLRSEGLAMLDLTLTGIRG
jgi:AcrR family transcriptional regulator